VRRLALLALVALALAGCGGDERGAETATLWVTRDRGQTVLYEGKVPAGLTAMQALDRKLDIETRFGGRFVEAIDGIHGNAAKQRDWFWYVNGIEGDRSAAEYRLHPGDVEWWDYRSWKRQMRVPVVVGSFPEPFLHGYGGKRTPAVVVAQWEAGSGPPPWAKALQDRLARMLHANTGGGPPGYELLITRGHRPFHASEAYNVKVFVINYRDASRLARNPTLAKFRYEGLRP